MRDSLVHKFLMVFAAISLLASCQKEADGLINGTVTPVAMKPKQGTQWTYRYDTFYSTGGLDKTTTLIYTAVSEETYSGEKWLRIRQTLPDSSIYLLSAKTGGLFQYTNNNAYLFCRDPAALNDSYSSFNSGSPETFVVKGVNDTIGLNIGNLAVNYYEGTKAGDVIDKIWYNENVWIAQKFFYIRTLSNDYYRRSAMYLTALKY
jgi:hypothetical protein